MCCPKCCPPCNEPRHEPDPSHSAASANDTARLLELEQRLSDEARPFALTTVVRAVPPTSTWVGAQALVESDGTLHGWIGGGCSRALVIQAALASMRSGQPKLIRISNAEPAPEADVEHHAMPCASNGTIELFIQPCLPAPRVLVLGSTPAALEACVLARRMGLRVQAAAQVTEPFAALGVESVLQGFDTDAFCRLEPQFILVATQGDGDEAALEAALRTQAAAVLMIASQRKADRLRETLRARGIPATRLAALHTPAGPHIHARTPQESRWARSRVSWPCAARSNSRRPIPRTRMRAPRANSRHCPPCRRASRIASAEPPARYVNPVCGMAVDVASAKHVVEHGGHRFYFCCDGCKVEFERTPDRYLAIAQQQETV
ncbi:MAG: XdhC family protein [Pararobbsia sp.]